MLNALKNKTLNEGTADVLLDVLYRKVSFINFIRIVRFHLPKFSLALAAAMLLVMSACGSETQSDLKTVGEGNGLATYKSFSSTPGAGTLVPNSAPLVVAAGPDGTTYLGGTFTNIGTYQGFGAVLNGSTGALLDPLPPKVNGIIYAAAADGSGGWYIGGNFTMVGDQPRNGLARILSDGSLDSTWTPSAIDQTGIAGSVRSIAVSPDGAKVYVGGTFSYINGLKRVRLAALSPTTGEPSAWNPSPNGAVFALAVSSDSTKVYAGGNFGSIGGETRSNLVALDANGTGKFAVPYVVAAWGTNANAASTVYALALSGSNLYVGGAFSTTIGGQSRKYIAALDTSTGLATAWNPNANSQVNSIVVNAAGSVVYAGGSFSKIGSDATQQTRNYIAALNASDAKVTTWNPNSSSTTNALALSADGSTIYVGGFFATIGGQTRNNLAAITTDTGVATAWNPNPNNSVNAVSISGSNVYAGGLFNSFSWVTRNRMAAIAADGTLLDWNANANNSVKGIAVSADGSTVYVGGLFTKIGTDAVQATRNYIGALNASDGKVTTWNPNISSLSASGVETLLLSGDTLYAAGTFTKSGGAARSKIASYNTTTGALNAWDPNANGTVSSIAVSGSTVYVGGAFTIIGGQTRYRLAALDASSGLATAWDPLVGNGTKGVLGIAVSADAQTVYIGGDFTQVSGTVRNRIAAVNASGNGAAVPYLLAWNPNFNAVVNAVAVNGSTIYAGGGFTVVNGAFSIGVSTTRNYLAALDSTTGVATDWNPNPSSAINTLAFIGSTLYTGGSGVRPYFSTFTEPVVGDTTPPVISDVAPITDATVSDANVSYTLSEEIASGTVTWTRTGGAADAVVHTQELTGATELAAGAHTNITLTNNPTLVNGAVYSVAFNATDAASNTAETVTSTNVTYSSNASPSDISLSATSVAENSASGTTVGTLSTTDANVGDSFTYTLVAGTGDTNNSSFTIEGSALKTAAEFNFEVKSSYSVRIRTTDAASATFEKAFTVTVTNVNEAPTATDQSVSTNEDVAKGIVLAGADVDSGTTLTFSTTGCDAAVNGALSGFNADTGAVTFTPTANFNGVGTFKFKVNDGALDSACATVTVTVNAVNDAPTIVALSSPIDMEEDSTIPFSFDELVGALSVVDAEGDTVSFVIPSVLSGTIEKSVTEGVWLPADAGTTISVGQSARWTPALNATGVTDAFTMIATDGTTDSSPITVTFNVTSVNDVPVATAQSISTDEDVFIDITLVGTDAEGSTLTYEIVDSPAHGLLDTINADTHVVRYTPASNYGGADSFTFRVNDGTVYSEKATVSITVDVVNDSPTLEAYPLVDATEDTPFTFTYDELVSAASDVENDTLTFIITAVPNGTLEKSDGEGGWITAGASDTISSGESARWTPPANATGTIEGISLKVNDGNSDSNVVTASFNVAAVADAPTLTSISTLGSATEDTVKFITYADLLAASNAVDPDEGAIIIFRVEAVSSGVLKKSGLAVTPGDTTIGAGEQLAWWADTNANGVQNAFTVVASDGTLFSSTPVQVKVDVTAVNDKPTLSAITTIEGGTEDTPKTITYADLAAAADEADIDDVNVGFRIEEVSTGTLTKGGAPVTPETTTIGVGEELVWTPAANASGELNAFVVTAWDDPVISDDAVQVKVNVAAVNEAPVASDVTFSGTMKVGQTLTGSYSYNDEESDPDSGTTFRWLASSTEGGSYEAITGATASTFVVTSAEAHKYIKFEVKPNDIGVAVQSAAQLVGDTLPTAASVAASSGVSVGGTFTGSYVYNDADGDTESGSTFRWLVSDTADGEYVAISDQTSSTFSPIAEHAHKYIKFEVTPKNANGEGSAVLSSAQQVSDTVPDVSNVRFSGLLKVGQELTGAYTYNDSDGDVESGSTFRWLIGDTSDGEFAAIDGATAITFTITSTQAHKYIKFEVTPKNAKGAGLAVLNDAQLIMDTDPVLASIGAQSGSENTELTFTISATDADGDAITYSATGLPEGATLDSSTGAFAWTPTYDQAGVHSVTFKATANGRTDSEVVDITIADVDRDPVLASIGAKTIAENSALTFTISATDGDDDSIAYTATGMPDGASLGMANGAFAWTPTYDQAGEYTVTFIATANGKTDSEEVVITVTATNRKPVANSQSVSATEDVAKSITLSGSDADSDTFTYIIVDEPSHGALSGTPPSVTYTPTGNYNGSDSFTFKVNDGTADSEELATVSITVAAANDAPTDIALSASTVAENAASGTTVGTLSTTDVDSGDSFTYTLVAGDGDTDNASFSISGASLKTAEEFNYEAKSSYSVRVRATDSGEGTFEKAFTITVTNANEAPSDIALSASTVAENAASGTTVGTLSSTDADAGDSFTYTLVSGDGDTDNASFTIAGASLKTAEEFNYESKSSYNIRVRATDASSATFEKALTITVTNVNEAPSDIAISASSVAENAASGTVVATLSATDADGGDSFTYELIAGDGDTDNASFTIDGASLKTAAAFNYESKSSYNVRIKATDASSSTFEKALTITVTNVNEAPTANAQEVSTNEDTAKDITLGGSDVEDSSLTYEIVDAPTHGSLGEINADTHVVRYTPTANYNGADSFTFKVKDGELYSEKATISITVAAIDDVPTATSVSISGTMEIGQVLTGNYTYNDADGDAEGTSTFRWLRSSSADSGYEAISSATATTYTLTADDATKYIKFEVTPIDENVVAGSAVLSAARLLDNTLPVAVNDGYSVNEDATLTVESASGVLSNDTDGEADPLTAIKVTDPSHGTLTLNANGSFEYAPEANFNGSDSFTYKANDGGGDSENATVTITVNAVNDVPSFTKGVDKTVAEDSGAQEFADWASSISSGPANESAQELTFVVTNDNNDLFGVQPAVSGNGVLTFTPAANVNGSATVSVKLQDNGGTANGGDNESDVQTFTITVSAANDAPTDISLSATSVAENGSSGVTIGTFTGTDIDAGDSFTYELVSGTGSDDNASFSIVGDALKTGASFNFEEKSSYSIRVKATDSGAGTFEKQFTINVTNVNEAPTDISFSASSIAEDAGIGSLIANLSSTDADAGDSFSYALVAGEGDTDNALFTIEGAELKSAAEFNYETKSTYNVRVKVTDATSATFEKAFTITITNVNEAPTDIALSASSVAENAEAGTVVGTLSSTDVDASESFIYTLVDGSGDTDNSSFTIVGDTLKTDASFNYESKASYSVRIRTTDASEGTFEKAFTINVTNVNEAPTDVALSANSVAENAESGTVVGTLSATDADSGDTFAYSLVAGEGDTDNSSFTIAGASLKTAEVFNYESKSSYSVRIRTTDASDATFDKVFTVNVTNANEAPAATAQEVSTNEDTAKAIVLAGTDADSDELTFEIVDEPSHGTLSGTPPNVTYTPTANYNGDDSFTFKAKDASVYSEPATVSITVSAVNDAPVVTAKSLTVDEDGTGTVDVSADASDIDTNVATLTYSLVGAASHGTCEISGTTLTYTPSANFTGDDSCTFKANDGALDSEVATVSITVTAVNDAPVATPQSVTTAEDTPLGIYLAGTDTENSHLTFTTSTCAAPSHGILSGPETDTGEIAYLPAANFNGSDSFGFRVHDGTGYSACATVTVTVTPVDDAPTVANPIVNVTATEDATSQTIDLSDVFSDIDSDTIVKTVASNSNEAIVTATIAEDGNTLNLVFAENKNGVATIVVHGAAGENSADASFTVTVSAANDAPTVTAKSLTVDEDESGTVSLTTGANDVDGDTLTYSVAGAASHGTCEISGTTLTYTPEGNFNGSDSCTFKANDGALDSEAATVSITVTPVDDAPVLAAIGAKTVAEGGTLTVELAASDADGDAITYSVDSAPTNSTFEGNVFTFTPAFDQAGVYNVTFTATTEANGAFDSETVAITVTGTNRAPTANAQSVATDEDTAKIITLSGADDDVADTLTYSIVSNPSHGTLGSVNPVTHAVTYTPSENYNGADSFTFKLNDGTDDSTAATVSITVNSIDDAPTVAHTIENITVNEDASLQTIDLSAVFADLDGPAITKEIVSNDNPEIVTASIDGDILSLSYAPNESGTATIVVKGRSGENSVDTLFTVTVSAENDAPEVTAKSITVDEDVSGTVNLEIGASDADDSVDSLLYSVVGAASHGTCSISENILTYVPTENFNGSDSCTFKASDGIADSNVATVSITVNSINDTPVANAQSVTTDEDTAKEIELVGTDVDANTLSYEIVSGPSHGTLGSINATTHKVIYTPTGNYSGADSFTFKVNDGTVDSSVATVSITVASVNDAPAANAASASTNEDEAVSVTLTGSDPENSTITFATTGCPAAVGGSVTALNEQSGEATFTPTANFNGSASFSFKVVDAGNSSSECATVSIAVASVPDMPVLAAIGNRTISENQVMTPPINLSATDADAGHSITYSSSGLPTGATLNSTTGAFAWKPTFAQSGTYHITFTATSPDGEASETITITVNDSNRAPTFNSQPQSSRSIDAGGTIVFTLTATDLDTDTLTYAISPMALNFPCTMTGSDGNATINSANGVFTFAPGYESMDQVYCAQISVTDGKTTTLSNPFSITVNRPDLSINPIDNMTVPEGQALQFEVTVNIPNEPGLSFGMSSQAGSGRMMLPVGASFDPTTHVFTWTPTFDDAGEYNVTFVVNKESIGGGTMLYKSIVISVPNVNRQPSLTVTQSATVKAGSKLTLTPIAVDPDTNDSMVFSSADKPTGATIAPTTGVLTWTPTPYQVGTHTFTIKATDTGALFDSKQVTVVVSAAQAAEEEEENNTGPLSARACFENRAGASECITTRYEKSGATVNLDGSKTTFIGAEPKYTWSQVAGGGCSGVEFVVDPENVAKASFIAPEVSANENIVCSFKLTATTDTETSESSTIAVTISADTTDSTGKVVNAKILGQVSSGIFVEEPPVISASIAASVAADPATSVSQSTLLSIVDLANDDLMNLALWNNVSRIIVFDLSDELSDVDNLSSWDFQIAEGNTGENGEEEIILSIPKAEAKKGTIIKVNKEQATLAGAQGTILKTGDNQSYVTKVSFPENMMYAGAGLKIDDIDGDGLDDIISKSKMTDDAGGTSIYLFGVPGKTFVGTSVTFSDELASFKLNAGSNVSMSSVAMTSKVNVAGDTNMMSLFVGGLGSIQLNLKTDVYDSGNINATMQDMFTQMTLTGKTKEYTYDYGNLSTITRTASSTGVAGAGTGTCQYYYNGQCYNPPSGYVPPSGYTYPPTQTNITRTSIASTVGTKSMSVKAEEVQLSESEDVDEEIESTNIASGDVNGDGYEDTVVGAPTEGKVYVYYGTVDFVGAGEPSTANVLITCASASDDCGRSVAVGDVSGDGVADMVIGAPLADGEDDSIINAGEIYIVYGAGDLPAALSLVDYTGMNVLYGTIDGGQMGYELVLIDADGNGTSELAAGLYNSTSLLYSFDLMTVLGRNLKVTKVGIGSAEGAMTESKVMLNLKLNASTEEDLTVNSITVTASGTGRDDMQISSVMLYEDVNKDGVLDDGDRQIGESSYYEEDNGRITFSSLNETISAGTQEYWMVVYRFTYARAVRVTMMNNVQGMNLLGMFFGTMFNAAGLPVLFSRRMRRRARAAAMILMLIALPIFSTACGDNFTTKNFDEGTLTFKASIADPADISVTGTSGGTVEIIGGPIEGDEVRVHIYANDRQ